MTTDSHMLKKEDRRSHEIFLKAQNIEREVDSFYATTYVMSEECKRKIGAALKGRKHTEQARKNMSLGRLKAKLLRETGK